MMKNILKIVAIIMTFSIFLSCLGINIYASSSELPDYTMTDEQWNSYWESVKGDNTKIALTVGADETELNFCWHSQKRLAIPKVRISVNNDMSDYRQFNGYATPSEDNWQTNRVTVTGLKENTKYYYTYALGKDEWSKTEFYRTLSSSKFKALLVGDIQCNATGEDKGYVDATNWNTILSTALKKNNDTSFIISCGDQTQTGKSSAEWAATLSPEAMRNFPMATCIGNHDNKGTYYKYYVNNPNSYTSAIPAKTGKPYYFRYGDVLFVSLNSATYDVFSNYNVVEKAVTENPDAKWRVAILHHDIYGTGHHAVDNDNTLLQGVYSSIMDKFQFDIAFTGHEHYYGRSYNMLDNKIVNLDYSKNTVTNPDGTLYITTASGSAKNSVYDEPRNYDWINYEYMSKEHIYSMVEFDDDTFSLKTYTVEDDKMIDEYTIEKTDSEYDSIDASETLLNTDAISRILKSYMGSYYVIIEVLSGIVKAIGSIFNF